MIKLAKKKSKKKYIKIIFVFSLVRHYVTYYSDRNSEFFVLANFFSKSLEG